MPGHGLSGCNLSALGLGPFTIRTATHPAAIVKGKKTAYEVRLALSQQGPVQLEMIEYQSGDTVQKDFLGEKGEGIHHRNSIRTTARHC